MTDTKQYTTVVAVMINEHGNAGLKTQLVHSETDTDEPPEVEEIVERVRENTQVLERHFGFPVISIYPMCHFEGKLYPAYSQATLDAAAARSRATQ